MRHRYPDHRKAARHPPSASGWAVDGYVRVRAMNKRHNRRHSIHVVSFQQQTLKRGSGARIAPTGTHELSGAPPTQSVTPEQRDLRVHASPDWDDDLEDIPTRLTP